MRTGPLLVLIALAAAATGADAPIPQDPARAEERSKDALRWNHATLGEAYDKVGKRDPKWDGPARQALDLAARHFAQQVKPVVTLAEVMDQAAKAVEAGCDDPMILYLYASFSTSRPEIGKEEYEKRVHAAAVAMAGGPYPPIRRATVAMKSAELKAWAKDPTPEQKRQAERELDSVVALLPASIAEDRRNHSWDAIWHLNLAKVVYSYRQLGLEQEAALNRVEDPMLKVEGVEPLRLMVRGGCLNTWGWEARTEAFAPAVSREQFRIFESKLGAARDALKAAWEANHDQPYAAQMLTSIERSIGRGDRRAMELWFDRAMKADGNDRVACGEKLEWLDPKWYGKGTDDMIAFGRACLATKNWASGIPLLAAEAHFHAYFYLDGPGKVKYMTQKEVWDDIRPAFVEYLEIHPEDDLQRSKYASYCYICGKLREAHEQFTILGDRLTSWTGSVYQPIGELKRMRAHVAAEVARRDKLAAPAKVD